MFKNLFNLKLNKGVTLVALIITIIVLLILAGVTINAVVGGEGTVEKASEARNVTKNSNNKAIVEDAVATAMGKEKGTTLHLDTLTNAVGNVGTVAQEGQYFTVTIQNDKYWVTAEGDVKTKKSAEVGDTVDYTTSLNNVTLDNWKVFYEDGEYTYLILSDYLLSESVTNIANIRSLGTYGVYGIKNRESLISAITDTSNWSDLLKGTLNGNTIDYTSSIDPNIKANRKPDIRIICK